MLNIMYNKNSSSVVIWHTVLIHQCTCVGGDDDDDDDDDDDYI